MHASDGSDESIQDDTAEQPGVTPEQYEQTQNLCDILPADYLKTVGQTILRDAIDDYESFRPWREKVIEHVRLHNGDVPNAGLETEDNITIVHLPYAKRAVRIFHSKIFPYLYPPTGELVAVHVNHPELREIAERVGAHMSEELRNTIEEYVPTQDRGTKQVLIEGSVFEVWWYDPAQRRPCMEITQADDFWANYRVKCDRPDLADLPRLTWRKRLYYHQLQQQEAAGFYRCITQDCQWGSAICGDEFDQAGAVKGDYAGDSHLEPEVRADEEETRRVRGAEAPREILEQDRWLKMPGLEASRAVTVTIDKETSRVIRISLREMPDFADLLRWRRETMQWQMASAAAQAQHAQAMQMHTSMMQTGGMGEGMPPPQEQELKLPPQPQPPRKLPWNRWTHYMCDVNPEGLLGHGVLHDIAGHNLLANKVATRGVSLMTLNMLPTAIASRQSRMTRGDVRIKLGRINESPLSPEQVQGGAGMFLFRFPSPDPNWFKVIELADKACQEVTAFDVAAGAAGMSGQTAAETEIRNSNALDNVSMVASRLNRARGFALRNLAYIYSQTLPDEGVSFWSNDQQQNMVVTKQDYEILLAAGARVTFTCDPRMDSQITRERRSMKAFQTILQIATSSPVPVLDPQSIVMLLRAAADNVLDAMELPAEWRQILKQAPLPNMAPQGPPRPPGAAKGPMGPEPPPGGGSNGSAEQGSPGPIPPNGGGQGPPGLS